MANDPAFRTKPILHYLLYIVLIGIGVAVLIYLLMHAHPMISPKVKDRGTSQLQTPGVHMERAPLVVRGRRLC